MANCLEGTLLDNYKVMIDAEALRVGGSWQSPFQNQAPTAYDTDAIRFFHRQALRWESPRIMDIGANTGSFCLLARINPAITCYAFEPIPDIFKMLSKHIELNGLQDRVHPFNLALSDKTGTAIIKIPDSGTDFGLSCLGEPQRFGSWVELEVPTMTLDEFAKKQHIDGVDLIKMDTEGCELLVLRGGEAFIKECRPDLLLECYEPNTRQFGYTPADVVELMKSWGYDAMAVGHEDIFFSSTQRPKKFAAPSVGPNQALIATDTSTRKHEFTGWLKNIRAGQDDTSFCRQTPESLNRFAGIVDDFRPGQIVLFGDASATIAMAAKQYSSAQISVVTSSPEKMRAEAGLAGFDLSACNFVASNQFAEQLWSKADRVLLYIDAHREQDSISDKQWQKIVTTLPQDAMVVVEELWKSEVELSESNAKDFFVSSVLPHIDKNEGFKACFEPNWAGGSTMGRNGAGSILRWANSLRVGLSFASNAKFASFAVPAIRVAAPIAATKPNNGPQLDMSRVSPERPIILISSCKDSVDTGEAKYNGGYKVYNLWIDALRQGGYEAFIVTYDGTCQPWLMLHSPCVSLETAAKWKAQGLPIRWVTGWADSTAFIDLADQIYFYDCEMHYTSGLHLPIMQELNKGKIAAIGTHSRTQQAWLMTTFGREVKYIPQWSDGTIWRAGDPAVREPGLVGFMDEGPTTQQEISEIGQACLNAGLEMRFVEITGDEEEVRDAMRRCDIFLGMNPGKNQFWGEGCPRSPQEAMHVGCVVVSYDVMGNREYMIDYFSGLLAPRGRTDIMAQHVIDILLSHELKERLRAAGTELTARAFTETGKLELMRDFLGLADLVAQSPVPMKFNGEPQHVPTKPELEELLQAPAYIAVEEIPVVCKRAAGAAETIVEIGSAYGASSSLMLLNSHSEAFVHSIDPFITDSMSDALHATAEGCRANVQRVLEAKGKQDAQWRWNLHRAFSYEVVKQWDQPIDLLYIDGDHLYDGVLRDFEDWSGFVKPGGVIMIHDSRREPGAPDHEFARGWQGPTRLAQELLEHNCVELIEEAFSLTVWRKTDQSCSLCLTRKEQLRETVSSK